MQYCWDEKTNHVWNCGILRSIWLCFIVGKGWWIDHGEMLTRCEWPVSEAVVALGISQHTLQPISSTKPTTTSENICFKSVLYLLTLKYYHTFPQHGISFQIKFNKCVYISEDISSIFIDRYLFKCFMAHLCCTTDSVKFIHWHVWRDSWFFFWVVCPHAQAPLYVAMRAPGAVCFLLE